MQFAINKTKNIRGDKMAEKLKPKVFALSLAGVSGIVYIICAVLFAIAPKPTLGLFRDMFHGIDITKIARDGVPFGNTVAGFFEVVVLSLVVGWLFAAVYNYLLGKMK